ncbi:hypothetical protein Goshw_001533 [Gossypium schwendimanii]|uniref:DUF4283 domain-containing protein n=1 Tax=Gossypium schwendimanii TaxID=34291 RepID=A0A7J9LJR0_GOSSC|nr:hypothetical protein [Gossypium schwendimanii]
MGNVLVELWYPLKGVSIIEIKERRILFRFYNKIDLKRVIDGIPWNGTIVGELHWRIPRVRYNVNNKGNKKVYAHQGVIGYSIPTEEEDTLGHRESFCPISLTLGLQEADGGWDISLRVPPRRTTLVTSRWLIEESMEVGKIGIEVDRSRDRRHVGVSLGKLNVEQRLGTRGISYYNYLKAADIELEDRPIGLMDGKKRRIKRRTFLRMERRIIYNFKKFLKLSHICGSVRRKRGSCWRFTGFNGYPVEHSRKESWNMLKKLKENNQLPWLGTRRDFEEQAKKEWDSNRNKLPNKVKDLGYMLQEWAKNNKEFQRKIKEELNERLN